MRKYHINTAAELNAVRKNYSIGDVLLNFIPRG